MIDTPQPIVLSQIISNPDQRGVFQITIDQYHLLLGAEQLFETSLGIRVRLHILLANGSLGSWDASEVQLTDLRCGQKAWTSALTYWKLLCC